MERALNCSHVLPDIVAGVLLHDCSEPGVRGALCTLTLLFTSLGVFAMYLLGSLVSWRYAALISLSVPIASMLLVLLVTFHTSFHSTLHLEPFGISFFFLR